MGQWVAKLASQEFSDRAVLAAAPTRGGPREPRLDSDAVIDFSTPEAMLELTKIALARPAQATLPAFVVGSTGWKLEQKHVIEELAQRTPVLMASNFSTGVLALHEILKNATPLLEKLGYTPVIVDTHHRHKKDAPSGTALSIQRVISPAGPGNVQTQSIRAGEIIGDHEVTFYGPGDHLTIGHFAQDRSIFARGAIDAALWLAGKRGSGSISGLIGMEAFFRETVAKSLRPSV